MQDIVKEIDGRLYVTIESLTAAGIQKNTIVVGAYRGRDGWVIKKDPSDRRKSLVQWEAMALRYKDLMLKNVLKGVQPQEYINEQKNRGHIVQKSVIEINLDKIVSEIDVRVMVYMRHYKAWNDRDEKKQLALAKACAICEIVASHVDNWKRYDTFKQAAAWIGTYQQGKGVPKLLPVHEINLKRLLERVYLRKECEIWEAITIKNVGNKNRKAKRHDELYAWALAMRNDGRNFSAAHIYRQCKLAASLLGWEDGEFVSEQWFYKALAKQETKVITQAKRFGGTGRAAKFSGFVPLRMPTEKNILWEIDATPINITPHYWEDPNEVTTKKKDLAMGRAVLSVVRDHATQDILGYSLDMSENRHMVINALRMAIERTGKLPYELRYDRGSWYGTDEVETIIKKFQGFGVKTTETTSPTGKPGVERWFETFQSVFLIDSDYYIGEGVKSRRENAHRSADQLTKQFQQAKRENWKFEDAVKEIAGYINEYRKTKLSKYSKKYKNVDYSPSELYNLFDDYEGSVNIERWEIADLLWKTTKLKITRRTVRLQVHNEVCLFPLIESKAAKYAINAADILMKHAEIVVKYDERDLSEVMIFTPDTGDFLGSLARNDGFDGYGKDAEWGKIAEFQAKQKQTSEAIKKKAKILMEAGQYDPMAILASHKVSKAAAVEAETAAFLPNIAEMKENIKRRGTKKGKAAEPVKVMDDFWGQW